MIRLYDNASSGNAYKVRLLLTLLDIDFERVELDIDHGLFSISLSPVRWALTPTLSLVGRGGKRCP